jgi:5-methylcytosine-specific restriction endonuclease McrA
MANFRLEREKQMLIVGRPKSEIKQRSSQIRHALCIDDIRREAMFNKQFRLCPLCTRELSGCSSVEAEVDHAVSVYIWAEQHMDIQDAIRYANDENNLILVHPSCNSQKNALDIETFRERIDSGEIVPGELPRLTSEDIEREKQRLFERGRVRKEIRAGRSQANHRGLVVSLRSAEKAPNGEGRNPGKTFSTSGMP